MGEYLSGRCAVLGCGGLGDGVGRHDRVQRQVLGAAAGGEDHPGDAADLAIPGREGQFVLGFDHAALSFGCVAAGFGFGPVGFGSAPTGLGGGLFGCRSFGVSEGRATLVFGRGGSNFGCVAAGFGFGPVGFGSAPTGLGGGLFGCRSF
ncbi:hypothetical protein, partial [Streptomyces koyangensis]|uniref:hypothetical protein n=1 Tax=Streptomyces koyangensis TaxID=188770 RepID=UPI003BF5DA4C